MPCTTLPTMCDQCRIVYTKIPRTINPNYLNSPENSYPVIFNVVLFGTTTDAREFVRWALPRLSIMYSREVPMYSAARRAESGNDPAGHWHDLTCPPPLKKDPSWLQKFALAGTPFRSEIEALKAARTRQAHTKPRDISLLVDFPSPIQPGGEIQNTIVASFVRYDKIQSVGVIKHPDGDTSLFRLTWWAETHPEQQS
ncbi:hypothetical protein P175DRAFT_0499681 [Aspergillus ochraceoroseus IBT 24754]|uniref:Uncharacterized protein n=1 Tax=Aspergillus ochraceoroseus IBT 24754 TaxID=1392256 RepID=A0A2T5M3K6_9EURO|nr:uncharacterized protein P175DRAFT_0499681 [Aspergillus ochraceoroseus IBT 24754]PTU23125.1 hypothetical protein P175DRAFT_0499681 [Aspergillus ochraceoroseus IBT 24754]